MVFLTQGLLQGGVEEIGASGNQEQPGLEEDGQLLFGNTVQEREFHVAFPSLEDDFDAPSQPVDGKDLLKAGPGERQSRNENSPVHEFQDLFGGIVPLGLHFRPHAPEVGRLLIDRSSYQADASPGGIVEKNIHVESSMAFEQRVQIQGSLRQRIKIGCACLVTIDAIRADIAVPLEFVEKEIAAVAQHEIALADGKLRSGEQIVFAVGINGEMEQAQADQIVGCLNPGVADL